MAASAAGVPRTPEILRAARRIATEVLLPAAASVDTSQQLPAAHLDLLAAAGLYGLAGPAELGGLDADIPVACQLVEVLASGCLSTAFVWLQHHGAVRAAAAATDGKIREQWLGPLCRGERRAGLALAGTLPGKPLLRARQVPGGYVFNGYSPWVTGWGMIDTLYTAARDADDTIVWALLDAQPASTLSVTPLQMVAVMAARTVQAQFTGHFVPAGRVLCTMPLGQWQQRDASGLRINGSLALGVAARCCQLIGPGALDDQLALARSALDAAGPAAMPAARAAASELAIRAAAAAIAAAGSTAILLDHPAQRLAREALFLLVFGSRPPIKDCLSGLLTAPVR